VTLTLWVRVRVRVRVRVKYLQFAIIIGVKNREVS
jgi:hypothetical protein